VSYNPQPTPAFSRMAEPDQGSGADEGVRPTPKYVVNFRLTTLTLNARFVRDAGKKAHGPRRVFSF